MWCWDVPNPQRLPEKGQSSWKVYCRSFCWKGRCCASVQTSWLQGKRMGTWKRHSVWPDFKKGKKTFDLWHKEGSCLGCHVGATLHNFSIARNRTKVIRSRDYPWGLPGSCLTEVERQKVEEGNRCFEAAFQIIYHLNKHHIPWLLENPQSSMCWHLPPIRDLIDKHGCCLITLDFCRFGTRWKKPTSILAGQLDMQDLGRLQLRCRGADGTCSRTLKKHWQLTGTYKGLIWPSWLSRTPQHCASN